MTDPMRMLRLPDVCEVTGLSPTTVWRREKDGQFPRRRRLGVNLVAWRSDQIAAWIDALPEADEEPDPEAA